MVLDIYIILAVMMVVEEELSIMEISAPSNKRSKSELGNKNVIFFDMFWIDSSIIDNE